MRPAVEDYTRLLDHQSQSCPAGYLLRPQDGAIQSVKTQESSANPAVAEEGSPIAAVRAALRSIESSVAAPDTIMRQA